MMDGSPSPLPKKTHVLTRPSKNIVRKGENAGYQKYLLFPSFFTTFSKKYTIFGATFELLSANAFNLDRSGILSFGTDLIHYDLCLLQKYNTKRPGFVFTNHSQVHHLSLSPTFVNLKVNTI